MQPVVTKRILGGIAWACLTLMTHRAHTQDAHSFSKLSQSSFAEPGPSLYTPRDGQITRKTLRFQPGLSSKEYLRLMAEANASELSPTPQTGSEVRQATTSTPAASEHPSVAIPALATVSESETPAHLLVRSGHEGNSGLNATNVPDAIQSDPVARPGVESQSAVGNVRSVNPSTATPTLSFAYENVWFRRAGDEGTSWSTGGTLGSWGEDRAAQFRLGWYTNPMERYEFAYLGSLVWHRSAASTQPNNSLLVPGPSESDWLAGFHNSLQHDQSHNARLRSFEWNKRWITDDLGNYFLGVNVIDSQENYGLRAIGTEGSRQLGLTTDNLLAGMHGGLELWHPLSQRFAVGGQGILGLYSNFSEGALTVDVPDQDRFFQEDERVQIAAGFGLNSKARYQFTSRLYAFGSYRWWYLAGMAKVDDQTIGPLEADLPFELSTDAGFLLHGATCGLEFVF